MFEGSLRYATAMASIRFVNASSVLDLTEEDFAFVTGDRLWLGVDRSRARRCVEALVYGAIDVVGLPRFAAPVEFIAAAIALYVHPVNAQLACAIMDGAQFSDTIISGVDTPISAAELFSHVLRVRAGSTKDVDKAQVLATRRLKVGA